MNLQMMQSLIRRLLDEGFYEIVFVLLMVHRKDPVMKNFTDYQCLDLMAEKWARGEGRKMLEQIARQFD